MVTEALDPRRHLALEGARNMRDLGGYSTTDGHRTRWRKFLRSATLNGLTETAQKELVDYGVGTVVDLRGPWEVERYPNVFAQSKDVEYHHLDLWRGRAKDFIPSPLSLGQAEKLADLLRMALTKCDDPIEEIMRTLAEAGDPAVVFHCGAGKDRTGLIAALLLGIAGVPHDTIAADFALTEKYFDEPYRDHAVQDPMAIPKRRDADPMSDFEPLPVFFYSCFPKTMLLTLEFLDEEYGGTKGYLRKAGLDNKHIEQLRAKLLD